MGKSTPDIYDYFLLVLLAAIFGGSFLFTKVAVVEIPAAALVSVRLGIAALIFIVMMVMAGQKIPAFGKVWWSILGAALFGNAMPFFLIAWGQEKVDAGLAAILMATMPLMTIVIAHFLTSDEKLTRFKIAGFLLGLLGVAVMIGFDKLGTLGQETVRQYSIIGGALCYAIAAIITKSLIGLPRYSLMAVLMVLSTLMMLPLAFVNGDVDFVTGNMGAISNEAIYATIILGLLPTAVGTILVFVIVARQGASFLSQINFMVPVFGVLWGVMFLSEILPASAIVALGFILAGVAIARINPAINLKSQKETNS